MHLIRLSDVENSERLMTQAVLQVTQMLGLYHAELARILRLQCADVGEMAAAQAQLSKKTEAWQQAEKLLLLFERLFARFRGEEPLMCNWLRRRHLKLGDIPLYLMVDDGRIEDVLQVIAEE